jgi:hypothetical protein
MQDFDHILTLAFVEIYGRNVALLWPKSNRNRIGNVKYIQPVLDRCWIYAS